MFNRQRSNRVLFVWDGTKQSIRIADEVLDSRKEMSIRCLHVLPHESFCAYATAGHSELEPRRIELRLRSQFQKSVAASKHLSGSMLEIIFGDRINETLRYSRITKANLLLMPKFEQSLFSSWIHGDLNRRIVKKVTCSVLLYDSKSETWSADSQACEQDENGR